MMRLIDADELLLHLADYQLQESPGWGANGYGNADKYEAITDCIKAVEDAPTLTQMGKDLIPICYEEAYEAGYTRAQVELKEAYEPKNGRWKRPFGAPRCSYRYQCSLCGEIAYQVNGNCGRKDKSELAPCTYRFCPNCGARMEE